MVGKHHTQNCVHISAILRHQVFREGTFFWGKFYPRDFFPIEFSPGTLKYKYKILYLTPKSKYGKDSVTRIFQN